MKLLLLSTMAWAQEHAAEAGHHEAVEIPWANIGVQAFNLFLLLALLTYLLRKAVVSHFAQRASEYRELVDRAENAKREAEKGRDEIQQRLNKLESSAEQGASKAKSEGEDLRARLLKEAKELSQKLEAEAQRSTAVELEKAKSELRKELLEKSLAASSEHLRKSLGSSDQKKLQNEFVEKIGVVGG